MCSYKACRRLRPFRFITDRQQIIMHETENASRLKQELFH